MSNQVVNVIGAGLAGSEAAWQIAEQGVKVNLYEMRKVKQTPQHQTTDFAELVCSNSLRSNMLTNAVGVLKEEMRRLNSVIMKAADATAVPAGGALAVDREGFAQLVTKLVSEHPNVTIHEEEVTEIPTEGITVIATGPLTSESMSKQIQDLFGEEYFYFYDAAAPIIDKESINFDKVYLKSRYDKGEAAYLNCPMSREEFDAFYEAITTADVVPLKTFEKEIYFEGCMPIEVLAKRGPKTMLFGPMKPVGLEDPKTDKRPFAVVQLRQDNAAGSLFNIVGFQTHMTWPAQKKVIQLIPGLENAEIVRYGVMHRNTFINSPKLMQPTYQSRANENLFFAGQMTGVEGYVESAASGLIAGLNAGRLARGLDVVQFPTETSIGSMAHYITSTSQNGFQPMNANFGLLPELPVKIKAKAERYETLANRALEALETFKKASF
ncbi:MAG: trmFO [Bacillales bacterium]|nr:trmFO [Bacillales bacterium]